MKPFLAVVALTGTLIASGGAFAFDLTSPSIDYEAREKSERLHVQREWFPGDAMGAPARRAPRLNAAQQPKAPAFVGRTYDLKGNTW